MSTDSVVPASERAANLLRIEELAVSYGASADVLHGVSIDVPASKIVCLLGANGAGKTTVLRAVTGLLDHHRGRVTGGSITFAGQATTRVRPEQAVALGIAQVLEGRRLFGDLTVAENLRLGSFVHGAAAESARERVHTLFPQLRSLLDKRAGYLSGGEQQMVAVGRALMSVPRLLLLDEPSLGLAPKIVDQIREVIVEIAATGTGILLVEQNAGMALSVSDVAYLLANGKVMRHGEAKELRRDEDVHRIYLGGTLAPEGESLTITPAPAGLVPPTPPSGPPPTGNTLVSFREVSLSFGGVRALRELSFDVPEGGVVAIIGPNGAGKTSLFNTLSGFHTVDSGTILFSGSRLPSRAKVPRIGIARTFQNLGLFNELTVGDNIMLGRHRAMTANTVSCALRLPGARREERSQRKVVVELLERYNLADYERRIVGELPYGIRKRVELVKALAMDPKLLLLDEPVAGMNGAERELMTQHLRTTITGDPSLTVMLVEHDMGFVMNLATKVVVLDFGTVIAEGTPLEVQRDPRVIEAYTGSSTMNEVGLPEIAVPTEQKSAR